MFTTSSYLETYFKLIAIHLRNQQNLDANAKAMKQINFTGSLQDNNATIFFRRN